MNETSSSLTNRREFIKTTGRLAAASALAGVALPAVHAASTDVIKLALVGCGGRGTGAADNALNCAGGPLKLVAMADVFENRLNSSFDGLKAKCGDKMDVPQDHKFVSFDGYKKAMDCLNPGDIVILTTPPAFRWVHFTYAIAKGLNVFMEKPVTVDGPSSRKMLKLAEAAAAKNLKVAVGLMSRHSRPLQELYKRIQDGEIGDVILLRGYRMHEPAAAAFSTKWPGQPSELLWQIQNFHSFLWASGGCYNDFYIHHVDHLCWMKNALPVRAQALGGRHYKTDADGVSYVDQNLDTYSVEYTFPDGAKMYMDGRCMYNCASIYHSFAQGSKGLAVVSKNGDCGTPSMIFKGQNQQRSNLLWTSKDTPGQENPYVNEWDDFLDAIRNDKPYSEAKRGIEISTVSSMGRMAAHTGQEITYDDMLNCEHEFAPDVDKLTFDSPAPVQAGKDGKYPGPMPGVTTKREY
jgi:predicted dehydrogenase